MPVPIRAEPRKQRRLGLAAALLLAGCAAGPGSREPAGPSPSEARALIVQLLPVGAAADGAGWATDIYAAFAAIEIPPTVENLCSAIAIAEQESGFQADPPVPGLGAIAWREIDARAAAAHIPSVLVHAALNTASPNGRSYRERIDAARTERDLSETFEDLIAEVPLGKTFLASRNPVRTGGPMQVSVDFAEQYASDHPYPYPVDASLRREVFSRRGGLYFGIAHLLGYVVTYEQPIFRFADFNAGHYASRNAGFQNALAIASGIPIELDGDLVRPRSTAGDKPGGTELAARVLAKRLDMDDSDIRDDLEQGRGAEFSETTLYAQVFKLADAAEGRPAPRAVLPNITLKSPKITRRLTTEWFARRVDERYQRCLLRRPPAVKPAPTN